MYNKRQVQNDNNVNKYQLIKKLVKNKSLSINVKELSDSDCVSTSSIESPPKSPLPYYLQEPELDNNTEDKDKYSLSSNKRDEIINNHLEFVMDEAKDALKNIEFDSTEKGLQWQRMIMAEYLTAIETKNEFDEYKNILKNKKKRFESDSEDESEDESDIEIISTSFNNIKYNKNKDKRSKVKNGKREIDSSDESNGSLIDVEYDPVTLDYLLNTYNTIHSTNNNKNVSKTNESLSTVREYSPNTASFLYDSSQDTDKDEDMNTNNEKDSHIEQLSQISNNYNIDNIINQSKDNEQKIEDFEFEKEIEDEEINGISFNIDSSVKTDRLLHKKLYNEDQNKSKKKKYRKRRQYLQYSEDEDK